MQVKVYTIDVKLPRWLKRAIVFGAIPAAVLLGAVHYLRADATVPNSFGNGQVISATQINDNFSTLQTGINAVGSTVASLQSRVSTLEGEATVIEQRSDQVVDGSGYSSLLYTPLSLTLTPGTWFVEAHAGLITTVAQDGVQLRLVSVEGGVATDIPGAFGGIAVGSPVTAGGAWGSMALSASSIITVASASTLTVQMKAYQNGGSTLHFGTTGTVLGRISTGGSGNQVMRAVRLR